MNDARTRSSLPAALPPYYSLVFAASVVALDYSVSPHVEFPGLFVVPVAFAAWYGGLTWALPMCVLPFAHVWILSVSGGQAVLFEATVSAVVRVVTLVPIAWWIASVAASQRALTKEVAMLEGLLPICSYCKKIRDEGGEWQMLEKFIQERTAATFTHGVCETCLKEELASAPALHRRSG
ncbi:MAG: hypothetical protein H0X44_00890 [Acidobacteria bacterium]|nr:hypothetical protein [Acidobacteriota bacterium]